MSKSMLNLYTVSQVIYLSPAIYFQLHSLLRAHIRWWR